jgi:hypothetical protein
MNFRGLPKPCFPLDRPVGKLLFGRDAKASGEIRWPFLCPERPLQPAFKGVATGFARAKHPKPLSFSPQIFLSKIFCSIGNSKFHKWLLLTTSVFWAYVNDKENAVIFVPP